MAKTTEIEPHVHMPKPKGVLIPIGGHEDKKHKKTILSRVIKETKKKKPLIEILTAATNEPHEYAKEYFSAFKDLGIKTVKEISLEKREESSRFIKRIEKCDAVFITGGDQLKLTSLLGGTDLMKLIRKRYVEDKHFVIAGTSAGAAAMSNTMIASGECRDALIKGDLILNNGLDLINNVFIDTHFTQRGRLGRIIQTISANPEVIGLGLGEDTAVVIYNGNELETIGSGLVILIDGLSIKYTNLTDVDDGDEITVEGVTLHVVSPGKIFSLKERKLLKS
jgi:cyanophycinase